MKVFGYFILIIAGFCSISFDGSTERTNEKTVTADSVFTGTVLLMRHAKSSHDNSKLSDFDRPLDESGKKEAEEMGNYLLKSGQQIDLIIASPSMRTRETAKIICAALNFDSSKIRWDSTIYRCTFDDLLNSIHRTESLYKSILVLGHNPAITNLANLLQQEKNFSEVKTGGIVGISFEISSWKDVVQGKGKLLFYKFPD